MTRPTRDSRRDALNTDPTKDPVHRAEELRKRFPQLFDFREDFTNAVGRYRSAAVKCGRCALPKVCAPPSWTHTTITMRGSRKRLDSTGSRSVNESPESQTRGRFV